MKPLKKIAVTTRTPDHLGGVVAFYTSVLPHIKDIDVTRFFLGAGKDKNLLAHPVLDQVRFSRFLNREKPDLVHVNPSFDLKSFIRDGLIIWQAKRRKIPVLVFIHGWKASFEPQIRKKLGWFFNRTYLKADHFIVLAQVFKKKLRHLGVGSEISLGTTVVDDALLQGFVLDPDRSTRNKRPRILFLSRIEKQKGIFETLDAVRLLLGKGIDLELTVAGDGPALARANAYVREFAPDVQKRICFTGYIKGVKKRQALESHDLYCFPTYSEGMPISLLEAMAFGMPVITTPAGGIPDFFQNQKMGIMVNRPDPVRVADAIEHLLSDKKRLFEISRFNHSFAMDRFSASVAACRLTHIYQTILTKSHDEKS